MAPHDVTQTGATGARALVKLKGLTKYRALITPRELILSGATGARTLVKFKGSMKYRALIAPHDLIPTGATGARASKVEGANEIQCLDHIKRNNPKWRNWGARASKA